MYCYITHIEKNKNRKYFNKYYKTISKNYNVCPYLGLVTDDMVFGYQCKLRNGKLGDDY